MNRAKTVVFIGVSLLLTAPGCNKNKTWNGPVFGARGAEHGCYLYETKDKKFRYESQHAIVETRWYDEWTSLRGETLPDPLPAPKHWIHPKLPRLYASTMHEDSLETDVSTDPGPIPSQVAVEYFHVLEKGAKFSGMSPFYTFLDDHTMVTISFGRNAAMLLIVDVSGDSKVLDYVALPGRGAGALELAHQSARMAMFRDTSGGAYSYLDAKGNVYVPGADNTIIRIPIRKRRIAHDQMALIDLERDIEEGDWIHSAMQHPENHITALMPDAQGRVWFTSKFGVVGVLDVDEDSDDCPSVYLASICYFSLSSKIQHYFGDDLPPGAHDFIERVERDEKNGTLLHDLATLREEAVKVFGARWNADEPFEQIQNSFAVGPDGIYIVSNIALYKLRFNDDEKRIEIDPQWARSYALGHLVYDNDEKVKPGHLNAGSGTTPTLVDHRFVAIVDNAPSQVNLNVFRQNDGTLVSKLPLFEPGRGAVENSVVAYGDSLVVGNTYGYVDPFAENDTAGGIMRFDYDEAKAQYSAREGWPAAGHVDAKTATPKLSTAHGLLYIYHRDMEQPDYHDWQLTALDFRTGRRVFSIKGYFTDAGFGDNVSGILERRTLGKQYYGRKVFDNIWGTFSFGPHNSVFLGTYRGFVRISSAPTLD
ncbi:MAG: hypothetical protein PVH21_03560 [Myxococcales bacterium]|jgi:hypothetical protein